MKDVTIELDVLVEGDAGEVLEPFVLVDVCGGERVLLANLLVGEQDVNGIAELPVRPVEEHIDPRRVPVPKPDGFESRSGRVEVLPPQQGVDVLRVPHRCRVVPGHPRGDGIVIDDRVGNTSLVERGRRLQESPPNPFHGSHHSFEGRLGSHVTPIASRGDDSPVQPIVQRLSPPG